MPATYTESYQIEHAEDDSPVVSRISAPYWLQPFFIIFCCLGLPTLVTYFLPASVFQSEWNSPKIFTLDNALAVAYSIAAFGAGSAAVWLWRQYIRQRGFRFTDMTGSLMINDSALRAVYFGVCALTLLGSVVWAAYSMHQGVGIGDAINALKGDAEAVLGIREKASTIPGLTTFTQFGMAAAVLAGILWFRPRSTPVRLLFVAIISAAFLRAFLRAERLALIEVMVPFCISVLPELIKRWKNSAFRLFILTVPLVAVFVLVSFFIVAEAGRSYEAKLEEGVDQGVVSYGANRIGGYYGTALNNGAYLLNKLPPIRLPYFALEWFWKFPGLSSILNTREMTGFDYDMIFQLLTVDMNPEFNNTSGIYCYQHDFGRTGLIVISFFIGAIALSLFTSYREGTAAGRLIYPMCVLALMEMARIAYFTSGRAFPSIGLLILLIVIDIILRISAKTKATVY